MMDGLSNMAGSVDGAFFFIIAVSVILLGLVTFFMIFFAIRYSRARHPEAREVEGSLALEIAWTVLPTILVLMMFYYGYVGFALMREVPEGTRVVKVTGRMWSWMFEYENGMKSPELVVERGVPVRLAMTATDVIHSLFIPAFRVKEDLVPGQETMLWFVPEEAGEYDLFCTEYCGVGHSKMITRVRVLEPGEYAGWYEPGSAGVSSGPDAMLVMNQYGCLGCHTLDGAPSVGPTLKGIMGRRTALESGDEVAADEAYVRRSITEPGADVVKGYANMMPAMGLGAEELVAVVDFLSGGESVKAPRGPVGLTGPDGGALFMESGCGGCHSIDGTPSVGPTLKGIMGRRTMLEGGGRITADEAYIRRSIAEPGAQTVKGSPPIMPPFASFAEEELDALVGYVKGL